MMPWTNIPNNYTTLVDHSQPTSWLCTNMMISTIEHDDLHPLH